MASFWDGITGDENKAYGNTLIPDKTVALAEINKFVFVPADGEYEAYYNIQWGIVDGDYTNRKVFQKIKCFSAKPDTEEKSRNMLMLLFKLMDVPVTSDMPTDDDLLHFQGKIAKITIKLWMIEGNSGNYVSKVEAMASNHGIESAFSRNPTGVSKHVDDDIAF